MNKPARRCCRYPTEQSTGRTVKVGRPATCRGTDQPRCLDHEVRLELTSESQRYITSSPFLVSPTIYPRLLSSKWLLRESLHLFPSSLPGRSLWTRCKLPLLCVKYSTPLKRTVQLMTCFVQPAEEPRRHCHHSRDPNAAMQGPKGWSQGHPP